ncbi:hypothetical protein [Nocardia nova]|uniref:hypothetical protein n=1 Tax=Nocardia nova TaxID=37330 RepID=UPI0015E43901|nr:hypothetical protein [Nocardia nova]
MTMHVLTTFALIAVWLSRLPTVVGIVVATLHPDAVRRSDARLALRELARARRWY